MDYKKVKCEKTAVTRTMRDFNKKTDNVYKSVAIITKRANQISSELKEELSKKLSEFATTSDNLDEIFENKEQIEIAKFYERLPKSTLIAVHEFLNDEIYYRDPSKDEEGKFV